MQTVLYVSRMTLGDELAVREIHERFPAEALDGGVGIERLIAFIGSGLYAMEITVSDGDFQQNLHRFLDTPEIRDFFSDLAEHVGDLPRPGEGTADMPLAAAMLLWQRQGVTDPTSV